MRHEVRLEQASQELSQTRRRVHVVIGHRALSSGSTLASRGPIAPRSSSFVNAPRFGRQVAGAIESHPNTGAERVVLASGCKGVLTGASGIFQSSSHSSYLTETSPQNRLWVMLALVESPTKLQNAVPDVSLNGGPDFKWSCFL